MRRNEAPKPDMRFEWDDGKAAENRARHGVDFGDVERLDWKNAKTAEDTRYDYGERRWQSLGRIGDRVHVVVYTWRGDAVRVISLRKANDREVRRYEQD